MTEQTQTAPFTSWLWPDHRIGIRESRRLREEHNALVNSHAEAIEACRAVLASIDTPEDMADADQLCRDAIANATPAQP